MSLTKWVTLLVVAAVSPLLAGPFTVISNPDAAYLASTTYIDISGVPDYTDLTSITDGILTVSFSGPMNKRTAPGVSWATWSETPYSQRTPGSYLPVLWSNDATSIFMTLSMPVLVFGFEAEPNPFAVYPMTATFYDAQMQVLGTIPLNVDGNAGARLFAASVDPIMFVDFSSNADFAVGAFRYGAGEVVPEPSTWLLLGGGLLALGLVSRRKA